MSNIDPLPQIGNALLAYDALKRLATRPGATVTISGTPIKVVVEIEGSTYSSTDASNQLDQALIEAYKLWQKGSETSP